MTQRLLRSWLFVPAHNPRFLERARETDADAVIIDLEDGVPPAAKSEARARLAAAVAGFEGRGLSIWVRVNPTSSEWWGADVAAATAAGVDGIRLPKVGAPDEVRATADRIEATEREIGSRPGSVRIIPGMESAAGVAAAFDVARSDRVESLAFGAADFCADIGADISWEATLLARSSLVLDSRRAGIGPPLDGAYTVLDDEEGLLRSTLAARRLGFFGRGAIHPSQVATINRAFTPDAAEVERAQSILERESDGAVRLASGEFVDPAIARRARQVLELASRHGHEEVRDAT